MPFGGYTERALLTDLAGLAAVVVMPQRDERYKRIKNIKMNSIRRLYSQAGPSSIQQP